MLEEIIKNFKGVVSGIFVASIFYSCAPQFTVPTKIPTNTGYKATRYNCCAQADCINKGYDYCSNDDPEVYNPKTGNFEQGCSCHSHTTSSSSSSSDHDHGGWDRDKDYNDKGGHWVCPK